GTALPGAVILDLKRFDAVTVDPKNRMVTIGAGVNNRRLEEYLNLLGWTSGHFPQSMNSASYGGLIATGSVGIFSGRYGKIEDMVVALEVVLPTGRILQTKSIPRRSTGPNLNAMFIGAEGAFGIITQATMKIWPVPERRIWATYTFPNTHAGLEAVQRLLGSEAQPALVRLYDEDEAAGRVSRFGFPQNSALLLLCFEGSQGFIEWQSREAGQIISSYAGVFHGDEAALHWYRCRYDTSGMLRYNQLPGGAADAIEVSAPWDRLEGVWREMRRALEPLCEHVHCHFSHVYQTCGSVYVIFYARSSEDTCAAGIKIYEKCLAAALNACLAAGGSISHHHGVGRAKANWMEQEHGPEALHLLFDLKHTLDPDGILNPGVLGL
ncbi:MAG: FAD-binding oxidoreductase, partial [Chloroflexi bacterium]